MHMISSVNNQFTCNIFHTKAYGVREFEESFEFHSITPSHYSPSLTATSPLPSNNPIYTYFQLTSNAEHYLSGQMTLTRKLTLEYAFNTVDQHDTDHAQHWISYIKLANYISCTLYDQLLDYFLITDAREGDIRLVGPGEAGGVLEVFDDFYGWSSVCTTEWDNDDATVACTQLGFNGGKSNITR